MDNFIRGLRRAGGVAGAFGTLLTIAGTNWGVLLSAAVGVGAFLWGTAYSFASEPHVKLGALVFIWTLWSYIGISLLYRVHYGINTIPKINYAHGIFIEGMQINYDNESSDKALAIVVLLRNVTNGTIKIVVKDFRVIIGDRTIPDSPEVIMIMSRIGSKGITSGAFRREALGERAEGTMDLVIHYGDPTTTPTRQFRVKANLAFRFGDQIGFGNSIISEEDLAL